MACTCSRSSGPPLVRTSGGLIEEDDLSTGTKYQQQHRAALQDSQRILTLQNA